MKGGNEIMVHELVHRSLDQSMPSEPSLEEVVSGSSSIMQRIEINLVRQACKET